MRILAYVRIGGISLDAATYDNFDKKFLASTIAFLM